MNSHTRAAVIGGGVTGASVLYHLAKAGWSDVVLLERSELTAGSSWHAAGGTSALTGSANMTELHRYSFELYPALERESGQSCGFHHVGGLILARTQHRLEDLKILRAKARRLGITVDFMSEAEAGALAPILDFDGVKGILFEPSRGHVDPSGVTHAFAKAARLHGATIHRQCPVVETNPRSDGGWDIVTPEGTLHAEVVVNAAGLWAREVAALAGIRLPLMPVEHHYFVTETIPEIASMARELPLIGDADAEYYLRQEGDGLLLGAYEDTCTHWSIDGTPPDFGHELLPDDLSRIERNLAQAIRNVPVLETAGVKRVICGPMIFSPDLNPLIGPYPGLRNYWCACGVMTAFSQAGAVGRTLAEWLIDGAPSLDVFMWDVSRYGPWAGKAYTRARTGDMYSTRFKTHFPYEERAAGRPVRTTPIYPLLAAERAVFGASNGWESPLWFAPDGVPAADDFTFRRPNWFEPVGEECRALRAGVGLIETSSYGKFLVSGANAEDWLDHVFANRLPEIGRIALSPMLDHRGRIIGDYTISRLEGDRFLLIGSGVVEQYHMRWWQQWLPRRGVSVVCVSDQLTGFSVSGPNARQLLERLCDQDLSNDAFPFLRVRTLEIGPAPETLALRISFTGELGYELYLPPAHQIPLFLALREAGEGLGLRLAGGRALGSLRLEKGFPSWGSELSPDYHPYEAGLGRFVKLDKPDFCGRDAALRLAQAPLAHRLQVLTIDADDADAWGGEPVLRDGRVVGYVTTGGYGHTVGKSLALAYLKPEAAAADAALAVEIIGRVRPARWQPTPLYDPTGARMRG